MSRHELLFTDYYKFGCALKFFNWPEQNKYSTGVFYMLYEGLVIADLQLIFRTYTFLKFKSI